MANRRAFLFALCAFACSAVQAQIRYTVEPVTGKNRLTVRMSFECQGGEIELQMPNWSPGAYILGFPGRNVADFKLLDRNAEAVAFTHPADNSWKATVPAGTLTAEYSVPSTFADGVIHYSGPSTYLYVVGRKEEACRLTLDAPKDWKIAVGLDQVGESRNVFRAPDYDTLADNPVTMGDFIELKYTSHGKPMTIALRGALRASVDQAKITKVCQQIADSQGDFFGGLPFNKYVWHFAVTPGSDGGGGLEHLSSTQISLAQGVGPRSIRVCAHEFFHLWNVKRIRSRVLGPFDYTQLPKTGALYWLEGVTDYYASLLCFRYGILSEQDFLGDLIQNTTAVRNNESRLRVSPYESSLRVGETNGGRGNSNGYEISYYNLGWLVGLCLDIELRSRSGGVRSLDDAMRVLWTMCKDDNPGFEEGEIRSIMLQLGGPTMGDYFDSVVMRPGELPLEEQLGKIGLRLASVERSWTDAGFDIAPLSGATGVRVSRTRNSINQSVLTNDQILSIGGAEIKGATTQEAMASASAAISALKPDAAVTMRVRREGKDLEVTFTPRTAVAKEWRVTEAADGDATKLALRKSLYFAGKR
jgi:predicted metalloprotease with PDZ domain